MKNSQELCPRIPKFFDAPLVNIRTLSGSWTGARTYGAPPAGAVWCSCGAVEGVDPYDFQLGE